MNFFLFWTFFVFLLFIIYSNANNIEDYFETSHSSNLRKIQNSDNPICPKCESVITDLLKLRKSGANRNTMKKHFSKLCHYFLQYIPTVCESFSEIETDIILYIIDNKDVRPTEVCGIYYQHLGCKDPFAKKWKINIPPPKKYEIPQTVSNNQKPMKIVQITDVHYDPLYKGGSNAKCELPLCCEERNGMNSLNGAGTFGDYRVCDMPENSVINLLEEIKNKHKDIDYLYFTGDIIAHKNWETTKQSNLDTIKEFYDFIPQHLGNISVYPILGNHEAHPCNQFAPLNLPSGENINTQWLFDAVVDYWSKWLPKSALETIKIGGYYTVLVRPGFRIIGLNSNVCFTENYWLFYENEDPYGQLKWLVQVLLQAEKNNEKVHLLSHVPPGEAMCHRRWQYNFNRIIQRFANTISAQFNGHTHFDEFRIFKNKTNSKQVINVAYNGGSFTTFVGLNPDYRVYDVNSQNLMVEDYHQYTFNLSLANTPKIGKPNWYKLYSFKSAYGIDNLNYESLSDLNDRLSSNETLAQQYFQFHIRESPYPYQNGCNETCVQSKICHISAIDADKSIKCGEFSITY